MLGISFELSRKYTYGRRSMSLGRGGPYKPSESEVNEQYMLDKNPNTGLLLTQPIYRTIKDPKTGDYDFGKLTDQYYTLLGKDKQHWWDGIGKSTDIHKPIKAAIINALNEDPPLEIEFNWAYPTPPNRKKGNVLFCMTQTFKNTLLAYLAIHRPGLAIARGP
jgi:hypothetical protein